MCFQMHTHTYAIHENRGHKFERENGGVLWRVWSEGRDVENGADIL